ncbi:preprotein translocase subunit SecG [Marinicella gelatinilytica]|uniref:preprotein translocase subunit SecG n=1 Tax=Marinicella gelatinilytica TaxID=2996017 RepID=UPI00226093D7|nr:preprotein translocase subunit SecG [Marinicella gelatinilytica]MCX7544807.1 preprotein translocase subunit SecG [Marinicella gelatinilytica]
MTINFLNIIQVLVTIALIGFILVQRGPGATAGSAFGSGASGTVFGAKGSSSFLSKSTAVLATLFFIITMAISMDFQNTHGVTDKAEGQDLGVMGTLDSGQRTDALIPGEGDMANDNLPQQQTQSAEQAEQNTVEPVEPTNEDASEVQPQPIDEDQGGNQ